MRILIIERISTPSGPADGHQGSTPTESWGSRGLAGLTRTNGPCAAEFAQKLGGTTKRPLDKGFTVERVTGIEPAWPAWKAAVTVRTSA